MEEILTYLIMLIPSAASILGIGISVIRMVKKYDDLKKAVDDKTDMEDLKKKLEVVLSENRELKALLKKDIEAQTRIKED